MTVQRATCKVPSFFRGVLCVVLCAWFVAQRPDRLLGQDAEKKQPERIVSINLCTDELLLRLVPPERVAGLTKHSENPAITTISDQADGIKRIQGNIEDVVACQPDLLLGGRFSHRETLRFFEKSKVPVFVFGVPKDFEDIYHDIRLLAFAVGEPARGEAIIEEMQKELTALHVDAPAPRRAVFFQSGGYVPGIDTFENAIMEAAGLKNVAAEAGILEYGNLSLEKLIELKPEVIIFSGDQMERKTVRGEILTHPVIRKAFPNAKIVTLPAALLNCGSPASVKAVRILVEEAFS